MIVAAAGDFRKADMAAKLDALLANWPFKGEAAPPVPKPSHALSPGTFLVDKDVNQGRVSILLPGLMRTDPDFVPAAVMNDILGGRRLHEPHHEPRPLRRGPRVLGRLRRSSAASGTRAASAPRSSPRCERRRTPRRSSSRR